MNQGIAMEHASGTADLADHLLTTWLLGDVSALSTELEKVSASAPNPSSEFEAEQFELLTSLATSMRRESDLFGSDYRNPRLALWADLLRHLSTRRQ